MKYIRGGKRRSSIDDIILYLLDFEVYTKPRLKQTSWCNCSRPPDTKAKK